MKTILLRSNLLNWLKDYAENVDDQILDFVVTYLDYDWQCAQKNIIKQQPESLLTNIILSAVPLASGQTQDFFNAQLEDFTKDQLATVLLLLEDNNDNIRSELEKNLC